MRRAVLAFAATGSLTLASPQALALPTIYSKADMADVFDFVTIYPIKSARAITGLAGHMVYLPFTGITGNGDQSLKDLFYDPMRDIVDAPPDTTHELDSSDR